jgi:TRAP-type mannitol/chloroaromatic compound transport system substrate-binding protein
MQSGYAVGQASHEAAQRLATTVDELSRGRLKIDVLPGGSIVPNFRILDAVHAGSLEAGYAQPTSWVSKAWWTALFAGVPFGLAPEKHAEWMLNGGGLALQQELYTRVLNVDVVILLAGTSGEHMAGWFKTPLRGPEDLEGLKITAVALTAEILKAAGASVIAMTTEEVVPALERGLIDAAVVSGPWRDLRLGLPDVRKVYHRPAAWLPPATSLELVIGRKAWDALAPEVRHAVSEAARRTHAWMLAEMRRRNAAALEEMKRTHRVEVVDLPQSVVVAVQRAAEQTFRERAAADPNFDRVWQALRRAGAR